MSVASSVITFVVQRQGGTVASSVRLPLAERLGNALIAYVAYIEKMLWPVHLAAYYPYPRPLPTTWVLVSAALLILASVGAIALARRRPYVLVGWLWYLGTLVPAIGIVQVGTQSMADRYTYIPLIGIFIILAWGISDALSRWPESRIATAVVATATLFACAVASRRQVRHWESSTSLWKHALEVTTDNYAAHTYYGNALATRGDLAGAIVEYTEAIRIRPDYPKPTTTSGLPSRRKESWTTRSPILLPPFACAPTMRTRIATLASLWQLEGTSTRRSRNTQNRSGWILTTRARI
jgi:hypothetical protein